ncbi:hypothetical protein TIFTF001_020719 [Ficus carica]|uniref:Cytochrome P450 n=1 Tax=Ficus carica TaxID=3494 RepID=A0AA88DA21_FICCA|nr:hypothetical protein TIFTF001_020719 [Ficus carica]
MTHMDNNIYPKPVVEPESESVTAGGIGYRRWLLSIGNPLAVGNQLVTHVAVTSWILTKEIARSKPSGEFLTWEDLANMKYTWRVAMATLRIVPPMSSIFWDSPMTQMDNNIYSQPAKFDPKRFENQASVPPYGFVAFGGGLRMCPGSEFARIETLVTIHYLVTRFAWKPCADNSFSQDPMPVPTQGFPVQIMRKKPP